MTVPRVGYRLVVQPSEWHKTDRDGPLLVAVLPITNNAASSRTANFADGVVVDIITALGRF